jgi:hypothetical protein
MQNIYLFTLTVDTSKSDRAMQELCDKAGIDNNTREAFNGLSLLPDVDVAKQNANPNSLKTLAQNLQRQARSRHN